MNFVITLRLNDISLGPLMFNAADLKNLQKLDQHMFYHRSLLPDSKEISAEFIRQFEKLTVIYTIRDGEGELKSGVGWIDFSYITSAIKNILNTDMFMNEAVTIEKKIKPVFISTCYLKCHSQ